MGSYFNILFWSFIGFFIAISYQNCSSMPSPIPDRGLAGGGLSLTTSSSSYDYNFGKIDSEISRYDDLYDIKSIDFLNPLDPRLFPLNYRIAENQKFVLIMVNGNLNPGAILKLNDNYYFATEYQKMTDDYIYGRNRKIPIWTLSQLKQAKILILDDSLNDKKIIATRTNCVASNHPGQKGEYRNGALVLQAVGTEMVSFDTLTHAAGRTAKLLWEVSLFQEAPLGHCY